MRAPAERALTSDMRLIVLSHDLPYTPGDTLMVGAQRQSSDFFSNKTV